MALGLASLNLGTLLALVFYASLIGIVLVTVRSAFGWLDLPTVSFDQNGLPAYLQSSSLGFYDKSEVRLAVRELVLLSVGWSLSLIYAFAYWKRKPNRQLDLHPATALFVLILYFSAVALPPFMLELSRWRGELSTALNVQHHEWLSSAGGHSFLGPVLLAGWVNVFGLSRIALAAFLIVCNLMAGAAAYSLIQRITRSRAMALLGASFLVLEAAPPMSRLDLAQLPILYAAAGLLLYLTLDPHHKRTWTALLLGFVALWNASFGLPVVLAATGALTYQAVRTSGDGRKGRLSMIVAMLSGFLLPFAAAALWCGTPRVLLDWAGAVTLPYRDGRLEYTGLIGFVPALLCLLVCVGKLKRSRPLSKRYLFMIVSVVAATPHLVLAGADANVLHTLPAYWILVPAALFLFYGFTLAVFGGMRPVRGASLRSVGLTQIIVLVAYDVFFPMSRLTESVGSYATQYEPARASWYRDCAWGNGCDLQQKPSLRRWLKTDLQPIPLDSIEAAGKPSGRR
jgi:hypothetical protein